MNNTCFTTVLDELDAAALQYGERIAVADEDLCLTWSQLRDRSRALAVRLCSQWAAGQPVAVFAARRTETPVLFFAALYSGCYYLPVDPDMPAARLQLIQINAGFTAAVGYGPRPEALPETVAWLEYTDSEPASLTAAEEMLLAERRAQLTPESPLYLVYTSGSTGVPKGVLKQHKAMQSFVTAFLEEYPISVDDVLGNQTPFYFDASAKDLYWCLRTGCRLEILPTRLFSFPIELIHRMNETGVTVISWVPSALSMISQLGAFSELLPQHLRMVCFVGEVFPAKQLARWQNALPQVTYVNLYGSSEIAGICCHCKIDRIYADDEVLPLGKPLDHCRITLLGENGPVSEPGLEGELCIESPSLAACYYNDPERTAAAFHEETGDDGAVRRILHTGDMAMYRPDGNLVFTSRRDFQIKHMGYRIELGEIETAATALPGVEKSACIYDTRRSRILLFVQPSADASPLSSTELLTQLKHRLCNYMLPQRVTVLDQLPLNANGKIDRVSLQQEYLVSRRGTRRTEKN